MGKKYKLMPTKLIETSEQVFIFGGLAILFSVLFFIDLAIYYKAMSMSFLPVLAVINILVGCILFYKTDKCKQELNKVKEIELVRKVLLEARGKDEKNKR